MKTIPFDHIRYMRIEDGKLYLRGTYTPEELRTMADWVESGLWK